MNSYLATATVGRFAITDYKQERHPLLRRDRSGAVRARRHAVDRHAPDDIGRGGRRLVQAPDAHDHRARRRRVAVVRRHAGHRAELGLHVRRGAHRRRRRLDDAARPQRAHEHRCRQLVPVRRLAGDPSVPRPLPDRQWRRHVHARTGTTGTWSAATGTSDGQAESWKVDLTAYAGKTVELSIAYASDGNVAGDTASTSTTSSRRTGEGTTSFEPDGDTLDGWTVPGAPAGSPGNDERLHGRHDRRRAATNFGIVAQRSFEREPEILSSSRAVRPLSVPRRGRHRRSPPGRRLRAREPDAADLRAGVLLRPGRRRQRRRPRAGPPVVRRQRVGRTTGRTSGSTRASPRMPSGSGASTRASAPRRRSSTATTRAFPPTTRSGRS